MLENIKVNDRVKSVLSEWGTVTHNHVNLDMDLTRVCIRFDNGQLKKFHPDGRHRRDDLNPEIVDVVSQKWGPKEGKVDLHGDGMISRRHAYNYAIAGRSYQTESQAMIARRFLTPIQRQLAWLFEHCPDYDPEKTSDTWFINYNHNTAEFKTGQHEFSALLGILYMPEHIAKELCSKMNSEQVDLWDY